MKSKQSVPERQCCLMPKMGRNGTKKMRFRDEPNRRQTVRLEIKRQRYRCNSCSATVYEVLPDIDAKYDMTRALLQRLQKDAIDWTFHQAAQVNGVDAKQVERIFKEHASRVLKDYVPKLPRVLGMDEISIQKRARFVIGDIEAGAMLDMQMSRRKLDLTNYFSMIPGVKDVEVVCQDMWKDYRNVTKSLFPNAVTVIDKYHVQRSANVGMETVRRVLQQDISSKARIRLKNKRGLFLGRWSNIQPYTRNQLLALFVEFPILREVYGIKEAYYEIYDAPTKADASEAMDKWLRDLPGAYERPFKAAKDALHNWRPWILNYWDHSYTNAYVESLNRLIRKMNLQGSGYDLETLRAKALLKHGVFGETQWGEWVHIGSDNRRRPIIWKCGLGVPLSTWEADFDAGTF